MILKRCGMRTLSGDICMTVAISLAVIVDKVTHAKAGSRVLLPVVLL
jgi:hypothetical protein